MRQNGDAPHAHGRGALGTDQIQRVQLELLAVIVRQPRAQGACQIGDLAWPRHVSSVGGEVMATRQRILCLTLLRRATGLIMTRSLITSIGRRAQR
jgi:hypothetical protein